MKQHEIMTSKKMYTAEKKVKFVKKFGKKGEKENRDLIPGIINQHLSDSLANCSLFYG